MSFTALLMLLSVSVYVAVVMFSGRRVMMAFVGLVRDSVENDKRAYHQLVAEKNNFYEQKMKLEAEALKIFTLYEITKDITKSLNEDTAFEIFQQKLLEHVRFVECRLADPLSTEAKELKKSPDHVVFPLLAKRKKTGYLIVRGVPPEDEEKLMILGHQFALALRRVKLYEEIEKIAITDSLTGVHTRRYAMERLNEELRRSKTRKSSTSLLMIDIDFFKSFNDKHGHLTGDQVLREVGYIIRTNIREIDIAGRYGGEEFCVILPDTDMDGAQFAAERIRSAMEKAVVKAYDTELKTTVSIGIATFPYDGKTIEELIDKADWALYRAKKQGRNKVCTFGVHGHDHNGGQPLS